MKGSFIKNSFFFVFLSFFVFFSFSVNSGEIQSTIRIAICGNNFIDEGEVCDGTDLAGKTCQDFGFSHGTLSCLPSCDEFDTSSCYTPPTPPSSGGGGGGGGFLAPSPVENQVNFTGRAYPLSKITLLKDGQIVASTISGPDAIFSISLSGLSSGSYNFSIYGEDKDGRSSSFSSFSIFITAGVTTNISGIFIAPTISVNKSQVKRGDILTILGQSNPNSEITIAVNSEEEIFLKTQASQDGFYLYNFDTSVISLGGHSSRSRAEYEGEISPFNRAVNFFVGDQNVFLDPGKSGLIGDINGDGRVDLIDFSIASYWFNRELSPEKKLIECERLNCDGKIDLVDFSTMAYYWTG